MSWPELQTVPMLGKEAVLPPQKEFPFPRHSCLSREEEEVFFLFLWRKKQVSWAAGCQAQGELPFQGGERGGGTAESLQHTEISKNVLQGY